MLDITNFERFAEMETPFYFYDIDLFRRTIDSLAALSVTYDIGVHYAIKANSEERLLRMASERGFGAEAGDVALDRGPIFLREDSGQVDVRHHVRVRVQV